MCGRFTLITSMTELAKRFHFDPEGLSWDPRYNIAPSQPILTLLPGAQAELKPWGFTPKWSKKLLINARVETAAEKPTFKKAYEKRRCLVLADSFYEWKGKAPWRFLRKDEAPFAIAALYEEQGCILLTTAANEAIRPVHSRMPLILDPGQEEGWLAGEGIEQALSADLLTAYQVSSFVSSSKHEGKKCIEPERTLFD